VVQKSEATTFEGSDLCMPPSSKCPNVYDKFYEYGVNRCTQNTRNTFYGTKYLSHCYARFAFNPLFVNWVTSLTLESLDVIGHVTIRTADGPFLLVIS